MPSRIMNRNMWIKVESSFIVQKPMRLTPRNPLTNPAISRVATRDTKNNELKLHKFNQDSVHVPTCTICKQSGKRTIISCNRSTAYPKVYVPQQMPALARAITAQSQNHARPHIRDATDDAPSPAANAIHSSLRILRYTQLSKRAHQRSQTWQQSAIAHAPAYVT